MRIRFPGLEKDEVYASEQKYMMVSTGVLNFEALGVSCPLSVVMVERLLISLYKALSISTNSENLCKSAISP